LVDHGGTPMAREKRDGEGGESVESAAFDRAFRINFAWLIRLRFGAVFGQLVAIGIVHYGLESPLPLPALLAVMLAELLVNAGAIFLMRSGRPIRATHVAVGIGLDVLLFSCLLYFSGGPANPFSFLYLVHIALAAIVLPQRTSFALVGLALACSLCLFFVDAPPLDEHAHHHHHNHNQGYAWHLRGMWVAFGIGATVIVYLLQRVRHELEGVERKLQASRERATRNEHAALLAMLSTGAAHELGSPLATIAVAASELQRTLPPEAARARDDLTLIRQQVDRCRDIIDQLSTDAGAVRSEAVTSLAVGEVLSHAFAELPRERVEILDHAGVTASVVGPLRALAQALRNLVKNALDATSPAGSVHLRVEQRGDEVRFVVEDQGAGMTPEVLERATEPFFTTKPRGEGMGLGLFLTRSVAEQIGGRLELESKPGGGTTAVLVVPSVQLSSRPIPEKRAEPEPTRL
jgi:two-component system, sensor histidine kinase RegB